MRQATLLLVAAVLICGCSAHRDGAGIRSAEPQKPIVASFGQENSVDAKLKLELNSYGKRLFATEDHHPSVPLTLLDEIESDIEWMVHFGPALEVEGRNWKNADQGDRESREALISFIREQMYPIKVTLDVLNEKRRALLGQRIDPYVRRMELEQYKSGLKLTYKIKF